MTVDAKQCRTCGNTMPVSSFYRNGRSGVQGECKPCHGKRTAAWAKANPKRRYATEAKWTEANRERRAEHRRRSHLKRFYNLTPEAFGELLAKQNGRCALCDCVEPGGKGTWHVDHDHACCPDTKSCGRCIRGLLCHRCNLRLGYYELMVANPNLTAYLARFDNGTLIPAA